MRDHAAGVLAARKCQVVTAMESLEKAIAHASEMSANLEERLGRVLMPDAPSPTKGEPKSIPTLVGLAEHLDMLETQVARVSARLKSVIDRCEL